MTGERRGEAQHEWRTGLVHPLCLKKLIVISFKMMAGKRPLICHLLQKVIYTYNERSNILAPINILINSPEKQLLCTHTTLKTSIRLQKSNWWASSLPDKAAKNTSKSIGRKGQKQRYSWNRNYLLKLKKHPVFLVRSQHNQQVIIFPGEAPGFNISTGDQRGAQTSF